MFPHIQPKEKNGPHITVRFPVSVHRTITQLANDHNSTITEVVRALVLAGMEHATPSHEPVEHCKTNLCHQ